MQALDRGISKGVCVAASQLLYLGANVTKLVKLANAIGGGLIGGALAYDSYFFLSNSAGRLNLVNSCGLSRPILYNALEVLDNIKPNGLIECQASEESFLTLFNAQVFAFPLVVAMAALSCYGLDMAERGLRSLANRVSCIHIKSE